MPQLISLASAQAPWLLPTVGIALFIHKHCLSFKEADSQQHARVRAGARARPPKLKRKASKAETNNSQDTEVSTDREQEQLDAAGLGHDKLMEWFTEDEVEALHQAQANPAALLSLLTGNRFAAMEYDNDSEWSTEEGSDQGLSSHILRPLELLQDSSSGSPMSGACAQQRELAFQHAMQEHPQKQQGVSDEAEKQQQQLQAQLAQQLFLHLAKAELQHAEQQQQQQKPGSLQSLPPAEAAAAASTPGATAAIDTAADSSVSGDPVSDREDSGDYFDPNDYFAVSPAAATAGPHLPSPSPGHFLPRAGALWATSYPPRLGEDLGDDFEPDFVPDFEPDLGDLDWDFDAPDFDPGYEPDFDDEGLVFDVEGLGDFEAEYGAPVAAVPQVVQA